MQKIKIGTAIVLLSILLTSPAPAAGQERIFNRGQSNDIDISAIPDLELTAEQIEHIKHLRETHLRDIRPLQNQMQIKRYELKSLWLQESPDQTKIDTTFKEITGLREQMQEKRNDYHEEVFRILTTKQQTIIKYAIQQRLYSPGCRWGRNMQKSMEMRGKK